MRSISASTRAISCSAGGESIALPISAPGALAPSVAKTMAAAIAPGRKAVPCGTMDEVSSRLGLLLAPHSRKRTLFRSFRLILLTPSWRGHGADSGEKQEPAGPLELWRSDSLN